MANIREIQSRINSVKDTMKITNAMYMISSSKLTQARKKLADTEPYFYALQGEISRILRHLPELHHSYFNKRENIPAEERKIGSIVITADKGLAGAYNHNIVKLEEEILSKPGQHKLFVVGELGRHYFAKKDVDIDTNFRYTVQKPTMHRARDISAVILDQFNNHELDEVYVVYTRMENAVQSEAEVLKTSSTRERGLWRNEDAFEYVSRGNRTKSISYGCHEQYCTKLYQRYDLRMSG